MPINTTIGEIMTKEVFAVELDDTVRRADELMHKEHVRHIPVLEENRFIGLISDRTLANYTLRQLYDFDENTESAADNKISEFEELMERNVRVVYPEDSVRKAIEIMAKTKADCLPVVDWKNNLIGILTSTDVLLFLHKKLGEI